MRPLIALAVALSASPALADDCRRLAAGDRIEGELVWVDSLHPNGSPIHAPFLSLAETVCVPDENLATGEAFVASGKWVQLVFRDEAAAKSLTPGDVYAVAAEYDAPMTAWHIGDVMAFDAVVIPAEGQP